MSREEEYLMRTTAARTAAGALVLAVAIGGMAQGAHAQAEPASRPGMSFFMLAQASPGVEPAPVTPIPGQLQLNNGQRDQLRRSVDETSPKPQPVPRAFAPAVGMTSPPELKLEPLPEAARAVPGVTEAHRFALLDNGMLLVVGDNRLVVALIGPARDGTTGSTDVQPGR